MEANGLPSRTSILTAAARAFGSREPDPGVRNPDWIAERLIGPNAGHPISKALVQDYQEAMQDPDVSGMAWTMLVRTRFIDELMERAIRNGATQLGDPGRRIRYAGPPLHRTVEECRDHRDGLRRHPGVQGGTR